MTIKRPCNKKSDNILQFPGKSRKISRNDLCPCGSGKKYKKCCLVKQEAKKEVISSKVPNADLQVRLEKTRRELLALFRGLDRLDVSAKEMPQKELRALMELDADCAEALWAVHNPKRVNQVMMVNDTEESLRRVPLVRQALFSKLPKRVLVPLTDLEAQIVESLTLNDAYRNIPGMDPVAG